MPGNDHMDAACPASGHKHACSSSCGTPCLLVGTNCAHLSSARIPIYFHALQRCQPARLANARRRQMLLAPVSGWMVACSAVS